MNEFMLRLMLSTFLRAPDAGGGSGGGDGGGSGDGGGDGGDKGGGSGNPFGKPAAGGGDPKPGDAGGEPNAAAGGPYFPKDFPAHLKGTNDRETIDKIYGAFSGMREDLSKRGSVPQEPAGYKLELSEGAAKVLGGDLTKDRTSKIFGQIAHKHGLTDKQAAGLFRDFHDETLAAGVIQVVDPVKEAKQILGDAAIGRNDQEVLSQVAQRWETLKSQVDGLVSNKTISQDEANEAGKLMDTANGVLFLEKLMKRTGEHGLQAGGSGASGGITKAELDKRINDPRANPMHPQYDENFEKETNRLGEAYYANQERAA